MPKKKFRRYYNGSAKRTQPGKGSDRREPVVTEETVADNWCHTFGHKFRLGACLNCGDKESV
jgi:hypothetical protein